VALSLLCWKTVLPPVLPRLPARTSFPPHYTEEEKEKSRAAWRQNYKKRHSKPLPETAPVSIHQKVVFGSQNCAHWLDKLLELFEPLEVDWHINYAHVELGLDGIRPSTKQEFVFAVKSLRNYFANSKVPQLVHSTLSNDDRDERGFRHKGMTIYVWGGGIHFTHPLGRYWVNFPEKDTEKVAVLQSLPRPHELSGGRYKVESTFAFYDSENIPMKGRRCHQCHKGILDQVQNARHIHLAGMVASPLIHLTGDRVFCGKPCLHLYHHARGILYEKNQYAKMNMLGTVESDADTIRHEERARKQMKTERIEP
jgi:hypothetical protein